MSRYTAKMIQVNGKYKVESRVICEEVLGKPLPSNAQVHHVDENPLNNKNSNLIVCEDQAYHVLLHKRATALKVCGHANWIKCYYCGEYEDPNNLYIMKRHRLECQSGFHRKCRNLYLRAWREKTGRNKTLPTGEQTSEGRRNTVN